MTSFGKSENVVARVQFPARASGIEHCANFQNNYVLNIQKIEGVMIKDSALVHCMNKNWLQFPQEKLSVF